MVPGCSSHGDGRVAASAVAVNADPQSTYGTAKDRLGREPGDAPPGGEGAAGGPQFVTAMR